MIKKTKKRSLTRRTGRGTVMIIAALLSTSAFLRLGSGAGEAVAEAIIQPTPPVGFSKEGSEVSDIAVADPDALSYSAYPLAAPLSIFWPMD